MKKFFAFIFTIILCMNVFTACGMSDAIEIEKITAVYDDKTGDTTVTIRYLDDIEEPLVFVIPKGETGDVGLTGNGIAKVEPKEGEVPGTTDLIIYFTDGTDFTVTVSNGKDGVSVTNIKIINDNPDGHPEGSKEVAFFDQYDNQIGDSFIIPAGEDGAEITDIVGVKQADGSVIVTVSYTGDQSKEFSIPAAKGIIDISSEIVGNEYLVIIQYNDGSTPTTLSFTRPTAWLSGLGYPDDGIGMLGDFYFDTEYMKIYQKKLNNDGIEFWDEIADLTVERKIYTVIFTIDADMSYNGNRNEYELEDGKSFLSAGWDIPEPTKSGYKFIGWYTKRDPKPYNGAFTDLTPVTCNLTLYACWEKL